MSCLKTATNRKSEHVPAVLGHQRLKLNALTSLQDGEVRLYHTCIAFHVQITNYIYAHCFCPFQSSNFIFHLYVSGNSDFLCLIKGELYLLYLKYTVLLQELKIRLLLFHCRQQQWNN